MPAVSVVVPIYNCARYLEEAVQSVLRQTYAGWELLLADDGSRDGGDLMAAEYARRYAPRVQLLCHPGRANCGVSATRNLAIRHAAGRYVAFLDADDVWLPHKLERQVRVLEQHPEVGLVYGIASCVDEHTGTLTRPAGPYGLQGELGCGPPGRPFAGYEGFLGFTVYAPVSTVVARKDVLVDAGAFPVGLKHQVEDQVMWTRAARRAPVFFLPEPLALYRVHGASWSGRQNPLSVIDADLEFFFRVSADARRMDPLLAGAVARLIPRYWGLTGVPPRVRLSRVREILGLLWGRGAWGRVLARYAGRRCRGLARTALSPFFGPRGP